MYDMALVSAIWQALPDAFRGHLTFDAFKLKLFAAHRAHSRSVLSRIANASAPLSELSADRDPRRRS